LRLRNNKKGNSHESCPKLIALAGLLAMAGSLIYEFTSGDFSAEGTKLLTMPWALSRSDIVTTNERSLKWVQKVVKL
jgi:hypothetical protein